MTPTAEKTKEKKEPKFTPPSWIDKKVIKTLSKEKQAYWKNRLNGKPGQGEAPDPVVETHSSGVTTSFDNDGNIVVHNRESRRRRPKTPNIFTKATHAIKKERLEYAKQQRRRAAVKARKARKESNSQVS